MVREPTVTIRPARPDDEDQLYPLAKELATSFVLTRSGFARAFHELLSNPNAQIFVAVNLELGVIVGYLLGFRHDTFYADGPVGWVEELYTRSDSRRSGVGAALMRALEDWAWESGARLVALSTRRAASFYEAIGYENSAAYFRKLAPD